jgi:hypothetical protein
VSGAPAQGESIHTAAMGCSNGTSLGLVGGGRPVATPRHAVRVGGARIEG